MSVFHVFVLVLVMWAVHSHGRAYETESITYNNTQLPYQENMNTGPIIPGKLKPFDYFYLVLQWPKSYCKLVSGQCKPRIPDRFTLHGLWPQLRGVSQIDCGRYGNTAHLDIRRLRRDGVLVHQLRSFWPNWRKGKSDLSFWDIEYAAHGSCFFQSQEVYLRSIVRMMTRISVVTQTPNSYGVNPGTSYGFEYFRNKISGVTRFAPKLQCFKDTSELYQLKFCYSKSGALTTCVADVFTPLSNCKDGVVELPL